jgi:phosphatidate cytidylyltransferase
VASSLPPDPTVLLLFLAVGAPAAAAVLCRLSPARATRTVGIAATSAILVGIPLGALVLLGKQGPAWIVLAFTSTWLSDACSYFVGKRFGARPLAPVLSPNKTWEGAVGGVFAAALLGMAVHALFPDVFSVARAALLGAGANVLGQIADLVESALKRAGGRKDSGAVFPGYGGMLDKIDSLLFAAPLLLAFSRWPM